MGRFYRWASRVQGAAAALIVVMATDALLTDAPGVSPLMAAALLVFGLWGIYDSIFGARRRQEAHERARRENWAIYRESLAERQRIRNELYRHIEYLPVGSRLREEAEDTIAQGMAFDKRLLEKYADLAAEDAAREFEARRP